MKTKDSLLQIHKKIIECETRRAQYFYMSKCNCEYKDSRARLYFNYAKVDFLNMAMIFCNEISSGMCLDFFRTEPIKDVCQVDNETFLAISYSGKESTIHILNRKDENEQKKLSVHI